MLGLCAWWLTRVCGGLSFGKRSSLVAIDHYNLLKICEYCFACLVVMLGFFSVSDGW